MAKKLFIKTYGCQMNVYDSARMADVLAPLGYETVATPDHADMVILNSCHIREKAAEKIYSEVGRLREMRQEKAARGEDMIIAVAGCVAQAEGAEIMRRAPAVDMVFGPQTYHRLPEMVARATRAAAARRLVAAKGRDALWGGADKARRGARPGAGVLDTDFPAEPKFDYLPARSAAQGASAFLSVQEGCDKFCTFCVVPYTRGAEYSRPPADVIAEAEDLVRAGVREITLLGQNVNAYRGGPEEWGLSRLIRRLAAIEGVERLRYTTSHPRDMDEDLIAAHGDVAALMPFLHLPVQSGSDRILAAMNRQHGGEDYRRIVARLRDARPDIALSSDFIVGFPGESDADFEATLDLVRAVGFAQAYSFKYSPRPGTPGAAYENQVPEEVKSERLATLQDLLNRQQLAFNQAAVGHVLPVLLDGRGRRSGQLIGRSPYMQSVHVEAPQLALGDRVDLFIIAGHANSLSGRLAASSGGPRTSLEERASA